LCRKSSKITGPNQNVLVSSRMAAVSVPGVGSAENGSPCLYSDIKSCTLLLRDVSRG